jgi:hypothetical protein
MTAVEWLIEEWPSLKFQLPPWLIEKVIEMEKEQIIDAYIEGYSALENLGDSEKYYKETYKK